jgi:hypothetical protein
MKFNLCFIYLDKVYILAMISSVPYVVRGRTYLMTREIGVEKSGFILRKLPYKGGCNEA